MENGKQVIKLDQLINQQKTPMKQDQQLFFIALLPPLEVQQVANEIKEHFATLYQSRAAQKSPPHITLQPPFEWSSENLQNLTQYLQTFVQNYPPIPMILDGFGAFEPKVIYINVVRTSELLTVQKDLMTALDHLGMTDQPFKSHPFSPHLTVSFRDLTKNNFYSAWSEFSQKSLHYEFIVSQLSLLIYNGRKWEVLEEFPFRYSR
jgi:2'-5' RNA ligase